MEFVPRLNFLPKYNTHRGLAAARIFQVFLDRRRHGRVFLVGANCVTVIAYGDSLSNRYKPTSDGSSVTARHGRQFIIMQYLDLTLPTPAENLALDEALLEEAEADGAVGEVLRFWESPQPFVVVGRSSRVEVEVNRDACRAAGIPVLRRVSGGAAVVAGPGCLMYAMVLSYERHPECRQLGNAHRYVLERLASGLKPLAPRVQCRGTSDLAIGELKFSGNSARCRRRYFLYHGTLLYDFPLALVERCLGTPPRMPDYRQKRSHGQFVTNVPLDAETIRRSIITACEANSLLTDWPRDRMAQLVAEKYSRSEWNA